MGRKLIVLVPYILLLGISPVEGPSLAAGGPPDGKVSCRSCHAFPPGRSHPVGVPVPMGTTLPLAEGGLLDCTTCHDVQAGRRGHSAKDREEGGYRLRLPRAELCISCHRLARSRGRMIHGLAVGRAHSTGSAGAGSGSGGLDAESRRCLACHDGSLSAPAPVKGPGLFASRRNSPFSAHPVGVPYATGPAGIRRSRLRAVDSLPREIHLPEGKVGCTSCHSVYSRKKNLLVLDTAGSWLCLSCHVK